mmetsp:Transcript_31402/g.35713  ORF Transcript_31402/g.35713 Transcript_31402/m.35713 type:complete len:88 (-) Transcript_31402:1220-1483(-)
MQSLRDIWFSKANIMSRMMVARTGRYNKNDNGPAATISNPNNWVCRLARTNKPITTTTIGTTALYHRFVRSEEFGWFFSENLEIGAA